MTEPKILPLEEVSSEAATGLLATCMGDAFGREKSAALWIWKHHANPMGTSLGLAAYSPEGELIALRPFMRWRLRGPGGERVTAVRAVDTAVHPDWRRGGLFSRLTRMALDELEKDGIALVFNTPNDQSGPGYRKLGWHLLGHPRLWVRPRPAGVVMGRRAVDPCEQLSAIKTEQVRELAVWARRGQDVGLAVEKDLQYLDWRYARHPNLSYYTIFSESEVAVVRKDQRAGRFGVAIVDAFMREDTVSTRRRLLAAVLRRTGGAYVVMGQQLARGGRSAAWSRGFFPVPWRNVNLAVRPVTYPETSSVFWKQDAWNLSLGDMETF